MEHTSILIATHNQENISSLRQWVLNGPWDVTILSHEDELKTTLQDNLFDVALIGHSILNHSDVPNHTHSKTRAWFRDLSEHQLIVLWNDTQGQNNSSEQNSSSGQNHSSGQADLTGQDDLQDDYSDFIFDEIDGTLTTESLLLLCKRVNRYKRFLKKHVVQDAERQLYQIELEKLIRTNDERNRAIAFNLKALFDQTSFGMCVLTQNGAIVETNRSFQKLVGCSDPEKNKLSPFSNWFSDKRDWDELKSAVDNHEASRGLPVQLQCNTNETVGAFVEVFPITYLNKSFLLALVRDRSQIEHLTEELQTERDFLESIIENITIAIMVKSADGKSYEKINKAAEELIGFSKDEMFENSVDTFFTGDSLDFDFETDQQVIQSKALVEIPLVDFFTYHKGTRQLRIKKVPILSKENEVKHVVWIKEDITELMQFQHSLVEIKEKAEAVSLLQESLLSNLSHEIRTPISGMIGFAQVLKHELSDELQEHASMIVESGNRLMKTVENVMSLSVLESGNLELNFEVLNLTSNIEKAIVPLKEFALRKGLEIEVIGGADTIKAILDRKSFQSIIYHLVDNSIKFSESGKIRISVRKLQNEVEISVQDSGSGISNSFLPRAFKMFEQESQGVNRLYEGNGLGLSIVSNLVAIQRGSIHLASKKGFGTTATVSFPSLTQVKSTIAKSHRKNLRGQDDSIDRSARVLTFHNDAQASVRCKEWKASFREIEYCECAQTPSEVFVKARQKGFNLFLFHFEDDDFKNGIDLMNDLKDSDYDSSRIFVAMKDHFSISEEFELLTAGFKECFSFPISDSVLAGFLRSNFEPAKVRKPRQITLVPKSV